MACPLEGLVRLLLVAMASYADVSIGNDFLQRTLQRAALVALRLAGLSERYQCRHDCRPIYRGYDSHNLGERDDQVIRWPSPLLLATA